MVTRVRFSKGNVLASLGGDDHSIALWSLAPLANMREVPVADRMVHPWAGLAEEEDIGGAADRYGLLGQAPPEQRPIEPRRLLQTPWQYTDGADGGSFEG